jgi:predicted NBD/HSP70 family sugar kinase
VLIERHGRWLHVTPQAFQGAEQWFDFCSVAKAEPRGARPTPSSPPASRSRRRARRPTFETRNGNSPRTTPHPRVLALVNELLTERRRHLGARCIGIGVAVYGLVDADNGEVVQAPNLGWATVPLAAMLRQSHDLPVVVGNDATLAAINESIRGHGRDVRSVLYVHAAAGVGGGLILDGQAAPSRRGWAAEIGHLPFARADRPCRCGASGCWEGEVDQLALLRAAGEPGAGHDAARAANAVFTRAREGDRTSAAAVATVCEALGRGLGGLTNALDPEIIVLAGHAKDLHAANADAVLAAMRQAAMTAHRARLPAVLPTATADGALHGAAEAALAGLLTAPGHCPSRQCAA